MSQRPDDDLRALFAESRRAEEETAPSFRRVLGRSSPARPSGGRWVVRTLAAAAAVIVAVASIRSVRRSPETSPARIETWAPPTDFLREPPFAGLLDTTPTLPESVPDYSPLLTKEKGIRS
jgi:hypothetical protein